MQTMQMGRNFDGNQTQIISPKDQINSQIKLVKRDDKSDESHMAKKIAVTTRRMEIKWLKTRWVLGRLDDYTSNG